MIIWLASYPRSGNTYFRILLKHFYGINTYSRYQDKELAEQPEVRRIVGHLPRHESLTAMAQAAELYFVKTHDLPQDNFPAIYLVRDGRDVLLSYAWYILTIETTNADFAPTTFWSTLHNLIVVDGYFGGWGPHVLAWTRRQTPTAIVKFEDFIQMSNPLNILKQALHGVGYQPPQEVTTSPPPTFAELHQIMPRFFRKGQIDNWQTEMPPKLYDLFWQKHGNAMDEMSYPSAPHNSQLMTFEQRIIFVEKEKGITELSAMAKRRLQLLHRYDNELIITEEIIRTQQRELIAKEKIIQTLHTTTEQRLQLIHQLEAHIHQLEAHPLRPFLKRYLPRHVQNGIRHIRRRLQPQLGQFHQYSPIPLTFPTRYHKTTPATQSSLPRVSIVTPSFNQGQFLERAIKSVLGQNYPKLEYIIQDGASTDSTRQILEKYRLQLKHIESCQDAGQAQAINRGFRHATGDLMAWLNSDDLLAPGTVPYVINFFLKHPDIDVVYGHRIVINEREEEIGRWILPPHDDHVLLWADYIPQETIFWRRRIWEKAGGCIDESFHFALDWELLLRFREAGARFVRLPRFLAVFRVHEHQKTSQELEKQGYLEMSRLRERIHGRQVSNQEAVYQIRHYMRRHVMYHHLHRFHILH